MAEPLPSISVESLAGGLALHIFHSTIRELNKAGKDFAQQMLGTRRWFSVCKVVLSNAGMKGIEGKHTRSRTKAFAGRTELFGTPTTC